MGGGIKSKFKFPVPGRSTKKQSALIVPISTPLVGSGSLSKAQRVLGTDGLNIGSSRLTIGVDRPWETGSVGGVSISITDSNTSQSVHDSHYVDQGDDGKARWEEESSNVPRTNRSAHSRAQKSLHIKRSSITVGDEWRDGVPKVFPRDIDRRMSCSTIDTHYDSRKMPLSISQQTSNSAMAKGLPIRFGEPLGTDKVLTSTQTEKKKKKKPGRLDLSRLRGKSYRDQKKNSLNFEAVLGHEHVAPAPSPMQLSLRSPMPVVSETEASRKAMRKPANQPQFARLSPRSKGITDASALHRLYDQYEQTSFQDEEEILEEAGNINRKHAATSVERGKSGKPRPASAFVHSLIAPSPPPFLPRERTWGHSRCNSHDSISNIAGSIADSSGGLHVQSTPKHDYAGSVSSRYTRTSKASHSNRSVVESDRLQHSILSLSDSSEDEESLSPSAPTSRGSLTHSTTSESSNPGRGQQNPNHLHGATSQRKFVPSLDQLDENLIAKSATSLQAISPSSTNPLPHSNHSSLSTLTPAHFMQPSGRVSQSSRPIETPEPLGSQHLSSYGTLEASAVPFTSIASTFEIAPETSPCTVPHYPERTILRKSSNATSRVSHSSDQPTPPLSPNSVEFYVKSRDSLQRDAMRNGSSEAGDARLMAVTKQEEMLLAMLREKRAKMRETATPDPEDDRRSATTTSSIYGSPRNTRRWNRASKPQATWQSPTSDHSATTGWPFAETDNHNVTFRKHLGDVHVPSSTSRSDLTEGSSASMTGSTTSTNFDSRTDRVLFYLDQPIGGAITTDPRLESIDDYLDDSDGDNLISNERRSSRMQSRRGSTYSATRGHSTSSTSSRRDSSSHAHPQRKDSIPFHSLNHPMKGYRLQDVPEVDLHPESNEETDVGDLEDLNEFPQPPARPPSWPLPPPPVRKSSKLHGSASTDHMSPPRATQSHSSPQTPVYNLENKKSVVRLSAVGYINTPMPWWGDDD